MRSSAILLFLFIGTSLSAQAPCGKERWPVKTMQDSDAYDVSLVPIKATIDSLGSLPAPTVRPQDARVAPTEDQVFEVKGKLIGAFEEADYDVHMVLQNPKTGATMIAEIPDPACAQSSTAITDIFLARMILHRIPIGSKVTVIGVGFFDFLHKQRGHAPNGIELHPVLWMGEQ